MGEDGVLLNSYGFTAKNVIESHIILKTSDIIHLPEDNNDISGLNNG